MQKKIIALAIAAIVSAPAFADNSNFTFYGTVDVSNDFVNTGDGVTTAKGTTTVGGTSKRVISSNVSKFGFKGAEDLGNGLAAIWQIEQQIDIDAAAKNTFASRNTFAGLKSESFGTVLMGIHDTPYKIATRKLDVFGDNLADNRALLGAPKSSTTGAGFAGASSQGFELRPTDVLAYISPAFAGITVAAATVNLSETNTAGNTVTNGALSAAAMYDVAPFYGSVAYESHRLESVGSGLNESATRVGFGFKPESFELNVVFEKTTDNLGTTQTDKYGHTTMYVGGKYNIGSDAIKLAYTKAGELNSSNAANTDTGASQISLGYDLGMSKRTKLYALYTKITNGQGINYGFSQNSGAAYTNSGFGTSPSAVSIGMKHSF